MTFCKLSISQCHCGATFLLLAILKKSKNFFEKPIYVFSNKKLKFGTFWSIFLIQLQSASNWLLLAVSKKTQDIFWATNFFSRRNQFLNVLRSLTNSVASYNKFLSLAISTKSISFRKTLIFYFFNQILKVSRSLAFSVAFYGKFATFSNFSKKIKFFFSKNPPYFSGKKPKTWTFWKFSISQCHCGANLLLLLILKQPWILSKTHVFFFSTKNLNLERLEKT